MGCASSRSVEAPTIAAPPAAAPPSTALSADSPFQIMVLSHQGLFAALDALAARALAGKREELAEIRAAADDVFGLMKLHARLEDSVYFAAIERKSPGLTAAFTGDHKRSAEGRPALLAKLDAASSSDEAFAEGMDALRKFCEGNRAHQLAEEDAINGRLTELFTPAEAVALMAELAALDAPGFNGAYLRGIYSRLGDDEQTALLSALQATVPAQQFADIQASIRSAPPAPRVVAEV